MKLREFALLTDENVDPEVVAALRTVGFDVLDVVESGRKGASDIELLRWAYAQKRVVVSHDADFGTLAVLQDEPLVGLIFLRPGHIDPQFTLGTIRTLLDQNIDVTPPFVVVARRSGDHITIRVRLLGHLGQ